MSRASRVPCNSISQPAFLPSCFTHEVEVNILMDTVSVEDPLDYKDSGG